MKRRLRATGRQPEHDALREFLGYQRDALMRRLDGLPSEQATSASTVTPT